MSKKWSNEELEFLKENYKNMTYKEMADVLGRSKSAIDLKVNRLGLKKSKYTYDYNYFENIDTEEKAYWLGFIYADGGVSKDKDNSCELSIKLQARDHKHLKKFNKCLNGNVEISYFERECNLNNKMYKGCQIRFYSEKLVNDLIKHGVFPNKTFKITMPKLKDELMRHFIRGFFDGDGCFTVNNHKNGKKYLKADFTCAHLPFLEKLKLFLYENGILTYINEYRPNLFKLVIGGMQNCDRFVKYLYDDHNISLDRKLEKMNSLYRSLDIEHRLLRYSEMNS